MEHRCGGRVVVARRSRHMKATRGVLVAVDGVDASAIVKAAREKIAAVPKARRGGVSLWDASCVFDDLVVAGRDAGVPSARTLLLLYAADLAFRLRWEIRPALAEGRVVAAAPYVATAVAFGRAAGLRGGWLNDLFRFAPRPDDVRYVDGHEFGARAGFVEFGCKRLPRGTHGLTVRQLVERTRAHLQAGAKTRARG